MVEDDERFSNVAKHKLRAHYSINMHNN